MDIITMILACSVYSDNSIINAMVNINSANNPYVISDKPFKSADKALSYVQQLKTQGQPFAVGLMQIPDSWLTDYPAVSLNELLRPCKNMLVATQILNQAQQQCKGDQSCALSVYKTGDMQAGLDYANQIIQYAAAHPFHPPASHAE